MTSVQNIVLSVAALVAALVQLLFEAAFQGHASKARQHGRRPGRSADGHQQPRGTGEQVSLSGQALVRLCRGLQEELRRKDKELTTCKADVKALRIERRKAAVEKKQEADQKETLWEQLKLEAQERSAIEKEHEEAVAALQKDVTYFQHAKGAFQAQVHQLERDVGNLRFELAQKGKGVEELWEERSDLIDDKARLGRQIIELSKRAHRAETDLATARATGRALAANNAELQERLAGLSGAHKSLEKRADDMASELAATKGELAATRTELGQEVEELRKVLNATLQDKANLAANCCALEAQAGHMEADAMQLRAWLEEVIGANEALEARVEALEASAAVAGHEKAALEGWVRGSVQEQAAAASRLASFQALSRMLETDGVCKSALIGVLAIHLAQREHQLNRIMRSPATDSLHALQCIEAGEDAKDSVVQGKLAELSLAASVATPQLLQQCSSELDAAVGHEPRTPSRFALPSPGMASTSTSGHSSPCGGAFESIEAAPDAASSSAAVQRMQSGAVAERRRPATAPSPGGGSVTKAAAAALATDIGRLRRAALSTASQIPLPGDLLQLGRARSALPPRADSNTPGLWQQRLERHLRSRGAERPAAARTQSASLPGSPQMLADLGGLPRLPSPSQSPPKAFTKGPQVKATA